MAREASSGAPSFFGEAHVAPVHDEVLVEHRHAQDLLRRAADRLGIGLAEELDLRVLVGPVLLDGDRLEAGAERSVHAEEASSDQRALGLADDLLHEELGLFWGERALVGHRGDPRADFGGQGGLPTVPRPAPRGARSTRRLPTVAPGRATAPVTVDGSVSSRRAARTSRGSSSSKRCSTTLSSVALPMPGSARSTSRSSWCSGLSVALWAIASCVAGPRGFYRPSVGTADSSAPRDFPSSHNVAQMGPSGGATKRSRSRRDALLPESTPAPRCSRRHGAT